MIKMFAAAAIVVAVSGHPNSRPYVESDKPGFNRCAPGDVEYPCPGRLITVRNPLKRTVTVQIGCGPDLLLDTSGNIGSHGRATFDLGANIPGGLPADLCSIKTWSYKK